ncbi:hypothetical protein BU23DRAFT_642414 [Bimuria novae-zelandiae CBS 107.79]|uniref:Uncharacterized protein n=1 Tax=Bimuria novae-zelandiae CBS 107.79 TaxID=1447943 RepID=A0A6A5VU13_9PLEO|nr:hypothetical protein BU23DRAFT_642414 [Bimuria novae-zelandiae CBS 107.79]
MATTQGSGSKIKIAQLEKSVLVTAFIALLSSVYRPFVFHANEHTGSPWGTLTAIMMVFGTDLIRTALAVTGEQEADHSIGGLKVSIYDAGEVVKSPSSVTGPNVFLFSGTVVSVQLLLSTIGLFGLAKDVGLLVGLGLLLSILTTNLTAWHAEKFTACPDGGKKNVYAIMRGNGHRHVFIIRNVHDNSLNLEDLARAGVTTYDWFGPTYEGYMLLGNALGWLIFTTCACHITEGAGLLFSILALGSIANIVIAADSPKFFRGFAQLLNRLPGADKKDIIEFKTAHPIELTFRRSLSHDAKAMEALKGLDSEFPGYGEKLLPTFFPGPLLKKEDELFWSKEAKKERKRRREDEEAVSRKKVRDEATEDDKATVKDDEVAAQEDKSTVTGSTMPVVASETQEQDVHEAEIPTVAVSETEEDETFTTNDKANPSSDSSEDTPGGVSVHSPEHAVKEGKEDKKRFTFGEDLVPAGSEFHGGLPRG